MRFQASVSQTSFFWSATDAVTTDDGIILRYAGDQLIGVTVLNASTRA